MKEILDRLIQSTNQTLEGVSAVLPIFKDSMDQIAAKLSPEDREEAFKHIEKLKKMNESSRAEADAYMRNLNKKHGGKL